MTVSEIKKYISEKLNNKPILSIETWGENGTQKLYTPLEHYGKTLEEIKSMLDELEPKAKWKHDGSQYKYRFICSNCGHKIFEEQQPYCSNCGARMNDEVDNGSAN